MKLNHLKDRELLFNAKQIAQDERFALTKMLHHLLEIERRKLYCDLGYGSLFEYAVHGLKYSEATRRSRVSDTRAGERGLILGESPYQCDAFDQGNAAG